jgi:hypothetical protein
MKGIRVHHLICAHLRRMSLGGLPLACHVLLVEPPASGLVLVDSGLGAAATAASPSRPRAAGCSTPGDAFFDPREVHGPRRGPPRVPDGRNATPGELTTVTRRDRVVPWMVCRSTP